MEREIQIRLMVPKRSMFSFIGSGICYDNYFVTTINSMSQHNSSLET